VRESFAIPEENAVQLGIVGLPKVGKTTLFNTLTASRQETGKFAASSATHVAIARVPDPRLTKLRDHYQPRKFTPATVAYVDVPGVQKGQGAERLDLPRLREVDALIHVVRDFEDDELLHPDGSIDPRRDVESFDLELILADLELVERRVERLGKSAKRGLNPDEVRERELLAGTVMPALESEKPLRELELETEDARLLRGFQLLSAKPMLLVHNVDESRIAEVEPSQLLPEPRPEVEAVVVSAPIEAEIAGLDADDQREFLGDLGLEEPSLDRLIRVSYRLLGLISFFTVGEDEVRAWTVRRGTPARKAAAAIHSDIERGFIRAEVVPWDELLRLGSMAAARDQGVLRLEGKEYVLSDGEIVHFRFNV
jgi:hypothetical protein